MLSKVLVFLALLHVAWAWCDKYGNCGHYKKLMAVCEGKQGSIDCGKDTINIISAFYGRTDSTTCPSKFIFDKSCKSDRTTEIKNLCQGKANCNFNSDNTFGDPCVKTQKYTEVLFECVPANRRRVICERSRDIISCGSEQINIVSAFYGRTDANTCPSNFIYSLSCKSDRTAFVKLSCQGKTECYISSNNDLGDPCPKTEKYTEVIYSCVPGIQKKAICEGSREFISCGSESIDIISAFYGRTDAETCPSDYIYTLSCKSDRTADLWRLCQGKSLCSVTSNNDQGDPCIGTYKYLEIQYRCA